MSYQILILTRARGTIVSGVRPVSSTVASFETKDQADIAFDNIETAVTEFFVIKPIRLYYHGV